MQGLKRLHDASSEAGAAVATACVAATACIYVAEVVARYFFNAPLNWSGDVSSYLLCATSFLALPSVTRANAHIAIGYFVEIMPASIRPRYLRAIAFVAGLACLAVAVFIAVEGVEFFTHHVLTNHATRVPKWPIALLATLGLLSTALHLFVSPPQELAEEQGL